MSMEDIPFNKADWNQWQTTLVAKNVEVILHPKNGTKQGVRQRYANNHLGWFELPWTQQLASLCIPVTRLPIHVYIYVYVYNPY